MRCIQRNIKYMIMLFLPKFSSKWSMYPTCLLPLTPCTPTCFQGQERVFERVEPYIKFHEGSTLLHWASSREHRDLVAELLARGLKVSQDTSCCGGCEGMTLV